MQTLLQKVRQCTLCKNELPLTPKPILQASCQSKILIVGQAPGAKTHDKGIPFDDKSGERLRAWLGVSEAQFYNPDNFAILPMGFCYPDKGKSGDLPPIPLCAQTWRKMLLAELGQIKLTIILGKYAINWHLQSTQAITELAQDWPRLLPTKQLVLPHPSPRNNIWLKRNSWFEEKLVPILQSKVSEILNQAKIT